jgi:hypothetical protein
MNGRSQMQGGKNRAQIFKLLRRPRINSKESKPAAYVAMAGRYDNSIPIRFLAPIDWLKFQHCIIPKEINANRFF